MKENQIFNLYESVGLNVPNYFINETMQHYSKEDILAEELFLMGHKTLKCFWKIKETEKRIIVFSDTSKLLAEYYSLKLNIPLVELHRGINSMIESLALVNYFIEETIFLIDGNWLLKIINEELTDLLKLFLFWSAKFNLEENHIALKCLNQFINDFAKDIDLKIYNIYSNLEMMNGFVKCFFNNKNDLLLFNKSLTNPESSLLEL